MTIQAILIKLVKLILYHERTSLIFINLLLILVLYKNILGVIQLFVINKLIQNITTK